MAEKSDPEESSCCAPGAVPGGMGCRVEAIVTVDGRGQVVLPKEVRDRAGVQAGDRFAVISCESGGKVCCISLVRAEDFTETVKGMMGPMMQGMWQ